MNNRISIILFAVTLISIPGVHAQPVPVTVPVTADNFIRAQADKTFAGLVAMGGVGKFHHNRDVTPIDNHVVQRANSDTLYSTGVFDLDAGPVTIELK